MPAAFVQKLADSADIPTEEAEKRWKKAKEITTAETGKTDADGEDFWRYVTGVFKKSMGLGHITEAATSEEVHAAAHEAATSHLNDLPHPSQAQLEAGNYAKGHLSLQGLQIAIENPKGSTRRGVDQDGKAWESTMHHHYGYIKGTVGKDKDHLDVFIGDHPESEFVFVVDQVDPKTRRFDEHKIMLGFTNTKEARAAYLANYEPGWKGLAATSGMTMAMFKIWLKEGNTLKPMEDSVLEDAGDWRGFILSATSFADIAIAFKAQWPGLIEINRLTNNSEGDTTVTSTDKEDVMKESVEVSRQNVTVAEFFRAIKAACEKKGMAFGLDRDVFENPQPPSDDTYTVRDGIKYARYGKGEPTREYDGTDAPAKSETSRVQPYDYQTYILNHDGSMFNEICEFTFDEGNKGHGYYFQSSRGPTPNEDPDKKLKEWERAHDRKGAPTLSTSRATDAMLRSGYKRGEFRVKTELKKNGDYGDTSISTFDSKTVVERTEALLRNGLGVSWYVEAGKDRIMALVSPQNEWHSVEAHQDWTGKPGKLEVVDLDKANSTVAFGPDQMEEARVLVAAIQKPKEPAPAVPKNPKTGPQRVAVLRSMAADIPGLQDYLDRMDAVTTKKELRALDDKKYEMIPGLRGSEIKIGGLDLYWTVIDLREIKEREINKRLKEEAQAGKVKVEREKKEAKEREDLQLKRYKARPELKKVLDLISADFRTQIITDITEYHQRLVKQYFPEGVFNLERPDRKAGEWAHASYQRTVTAVAPLILPGSHVSTGLNLNPDWQQVSKKLAQESADYWIAQFEDKTAWKLGEVLERKGGGDVVHTGDVRQHAIRMRFPDGSGFDMRTQQVFSTSTKGTPFVRYPTTFHNVILPNGDRMSTPSAEKMQKEFGIANDKAGE